jgi:dihydrofolate reductase
MLRAIMACDSLGGIAKNGIMPWPKNKLDLLHFKQLTKGATVAMGRRTWEAEDMPSPLPGRKNLVITSNCNYIAPGAEIVCDDGVTYLTSLAKTNIVYVIGGGDLINGLLDEIGIFHITRIAGSYDCDTFIPLAKIQAQFQCIDAVAVDNTTTFETYITRKSDVLSFHPRTRLAKPNPSHQ